MQNIPAIALTKGGAVPLISLSEAIGRPLRNVGMGLGWDPASRGASIDLDASCVMLREDLSSDGIVYFADRNSMDGSVNHSGDNLTGDGDGDDEMIAVQLDKVNPRVKYLVFTVNSFRGQTFNEVKSAYCRLIDDAKGVPAEAVRFTITEQGRRTGMIMACLERSGDGWVMHGVGELCDGRKAHDVIPDIQRVVRGLSSKKATDFIQASKDAAAPAPEKKGLFGRLFG